MVTDPLYDSRLAASLVRKRNTVTDHGTANIIPLCPAPPAKTCQWLHGEPRERNFCGERVKRGSSYCAEHHAVCWHKLGEDTNPA